MYIKVNKLFTNANKRAALVFFIFIISLSIVISIAIYFREVSIKDQVNFFNVLLWQMTIWCPWIIVFFLFPKLRKSLNMIEYGNILYYGSGLIWVSLHFGWFFFISSNYSPYLGKPATGYGVYPYFFIFWTLIDFIIIGIIYALGQYKSIKNTSTKSIQIKLTRGEKTFFCKPNDLFWLSSDNYYVHLHTKEGKFTMRKTLKYYYELIKPYGFIQIHRSTIVNMEYVNGITKSNNRLSITLKDGTKKNVSKKNQPKVRSFFKNQEL